MKYEPVFTFCLFLVLPAVVYCNANTDTLPQPPKSRLLRFSDSNGPDSNRTVLNIFMHDEYDEPVLGATILLQRQKPAQVHGRISQWDGRCQFKISPGVYDLRVQLTGMVSYEQQSIELLAGRQYEMELEMARMKPPVPSAKSQAGKN